LTGPHRAGQGKSARNGFSRLNYKQFIDIPIIFINFGVIGIIHNNKHNNKHYRD
jgi:hypothetical protein